MFDSLAKSRRHTRQRQVHGTFYLSKTERVWLPPPPSVFLPLRYHLLLLLLVMGARPAWQH
jgi:hypothetical protein